MSSFPRTADVAANTTCTNTYCHGTTLDGPKPGGTTNRTPDWTVVDDTQDACGTTCHTNPPGGTHPAANSSKLCHADVIATYDPVTRAATWVSAAKHVDGVVESNRYHDLPLWKAPEKQSQHHGTAYFISNRRRDEHGIPCVDCHGTDLDGGSVGVSCNNTTCHGGKDWKSCAFCHGRTWNLFVLPVNAPLATTRPPALRKLTCGRRRNSMRGPQCCSRGRGWPIPKASSTRYESIAPFVCSGCGDCLARCWPCERVRPAFAASARCASDVGT